MPEIQLQPKQSEMYRLLSEAKASTIGVGGGRGAAKSSGADRVAITLMHERQGMVVCLVMRTWQKQIVPFHIEPIKRDFPWLADRLKTSPPAVLRIGRSQMEFKYAENYDDVEEAFRSGNYDLIIVDQAEQFSEREIREMRKACRSKGGRPAKILLLFNMRGSGIQWLRKWFHLLEFNAAEDPKDYAFLKVNPWDNVQWVLAALAEDGYSDEDYYRWSDEQRKAYAAERGPYTRGLASDDPVIAKADWEGDWDSLEGAYFANSFDLESVRIAPSLVERFKKPWANRWMAQDWGRTHWCATLWALRISLKPSEALELLGWNLIKPINLTVIYREMVCNEKEAPEVAQDVLDCMLADERAKIKSYFLSPEEVTDEPNSIGNQQSRILRKGGVPGAQKADNDRKGGYGLMSSLFKATKGLGWGVDKDGHRFQYDDAVLISSECAELLKAIPVLMRDPRDLDDVLKTDKTAAKLEQDLGDACFVAGTLIWTDRGQVPIEQVNICDRIMTRSGWKLVRWAWMSGFDKRVVVARFSNGTEIACTPNHKFWTQRGFISIDAIRYDDEILSWKSLSFRGSDIQDLGATIAITRLSTVAESAVRLVELREAGFADVYDLEVVGQHEFFANGILVHNCRYLTKSMLSPKRKTTEDEYREKMETATPPERMMIAAQHAWASQKKRNRPIVRPSWRQD